MGELYQDSQIVQYSNLAVILCRSTLLLFYPFGDTLLCKDVLNYTRFLAKRTGNQVTCLYHRHYAKLRKLNMSQERSTVIGELILRGAATTTRKDF